MSQEIFDAIVAKRGKYCEACYWNIGTELHHCIVHRRKGNKKLDDPRNLELLCKECHSMGFVNSYEHRCGFWKRQVKRGELMSEWYDSLNLKTKERFE